MKSFASDNYASVHPAVLESLLRVNSEHAIAYGADPISEAAVQKVSDVFGPCESFFVFTGTGANVISLFSLLKPFEAVICSDQAHINVDECGALERIAGAKIVDVSCIDAKLLPEQILAATMNHGNEHQSQVKVVSITQSNERGSLYSLAELQAIKKVARDRSLRVHMDGARFANAVAALQVSPREIIEAAGVDILSLGGTKNGLMGAEAILVFNPEIVQTLKFYRKQCMQLASKMRYVSAQFLVYFDFWLDNARHANAMAKKLAHELAKIPEIKITNSVEVNAVFAVLPRRIIQPLQKQFPFYIWDEAKDEVRLMCSFDTQDEDVAAFIAALKSLL